VSFLDFFTVLGQRGAPESLLQRLKSVVATGFSGGGTVKKSLINLSELANTCVLCCGFENLLSGVLFLGSILLFLASARICHNETVENTFLSPLGRVAMANYLGTNESALLTYALAANPWKVPPTGAR
jgi:hypothetical protein